jgi:hypothetical protein
MLSRHVRLQRILRRELGDAGIVVNVYGHLAPGYLRKEVDHLRFGV